MHSSPLSESKNVKYPKKSQNYLKILSCLKNNNSLIKHKVKMSSNLLLFIYFELLSPNKQYRFYQKLVLFKKCLVFIILF